MLGDRLRSSAVLIAIAIALFVADGIFVDVLGEGILLLPLLLFLTCGTAWDFATLASGRGVEIPRWTITVGAGLIAAAAIVPEAYDAVAVATDRASYPADCPIGQFGWVVAAGVGVIMAIWLIEMRRYQPVIIAVETVHLNQTAQPSRTDDVAAGSLPGESSGSSESSSSSGMSVTEGRSDSTMIGDATKRNATSTLPWPVDSPLLRAATAVLIALAVGLPLSLLVATRTLGEGLWGTAALLTIVATTKSADAGAYFAGKTLGRRKLIPRLSPGKTWEGLLGGVITASAVAWACLTWLFPLLTEPGSADFPWALPLLLGPLLTMSGVVGDLAESLVKRDCGAKDSGNWLPGLGGVWDVTDSLIGAILPGFLCFAAVA